MPLQLNERRIHNMIKWAEDTLEINPKAHDKNEIVTNCPFCIQTKTPDTKYHFGINLVQPFAHCFRCDWSGNWQKLIMSVQGCEYSEAVRIIYGIPSLEDFKKYVYSLKPEPNKYHIDQEREEDETHELRREDLIKPISPVGEINFTEKLAIEYLKARNIPDEYIYNGLFGTKSNNFRVYILSADNYWQGRALMNAIEPKYRNPYEDVGATLGLYDASCMKHVFESNKPLYITEGVFSALALILRHKPALCLYGKTCRLEQFERLLLMGRDLVVMLDADKEAKEKGWELAMKLFTEKGYGVKIALLKDGDPETCDIYEEITPTQNNYLRWRMKSG